MNNFNISKIDNFHSIVFQYFLNIKLNKKKDVFNKFKFIFLSKNSY